MPVSDDFRRQLEGYGLTTAKIRYCLPDNPRIISPNWLVRQFYDVWPEFPELRAYLNFWQEEIEGPLHSVTIMHARLITPAEVRMIDHEFWLN